MKRTIYAMKRTIDAVVKNNTKEFQKRTICAMKRTIDAVVKNNTKESQIPKEGNLKDVQIFKEGSASADPKLNLGGCPRLGGDEKGGEISPISMVHRHLNKEGWALRLYDNPRTVFYCEEILKYFKDGDEDVETFSTLVNKVLGNENVIYVLIKKDLWIANNVRGCSITSTDAHTRSVHQLSEIKRDWFFREALQGDKNVFFRDYVEFDDRISIVRNAMSILISYCLPRTYMTQGLATTGLGVGKPRSLILENTPL